MVSSAFEYFAPASVAEAADLLGKYGDDAKLLAGGHSLIPIMKLRLAEPRILIDLRKVAGLSHIREADGGLAIGAMTTYLELNTSDLVRRRAPVLAEAAGMVADVQVRNMGTIGGSLSHADPAGDLPAVALALGVRLTANSTGGSRNISIDDWFVDLLTTSLRPDEIVSEITIPALRPGTGTAYAKFANKASRYAIVGVAAVVTVDANGVCQEVRIGITGAGPKAVQATQAEQALRGSRVTDDVVRKAADSAGAGIDFLEDIHASGEYRAHLISVFAARAIKEAASRAG